MILHGLPAQRPGLHQACPCPPALPSSALPGRTPRGHRRLGASLVMHARRSKSAKTPLLVEDPDEEGKKRALEDAIKNLHDKYGKGSIMRLGDRVADPVETFPSGSLVLDAILGGGYPKGRIIEIFGPESSGKTTVALHAIAEVQKAGGTACLVDAEHAFDPAYAKKMGVDMDELLLCQPDSGEHALDVADELARSSAVGLVVVDSVSALLPKAELEGEIGAPGVGLQARLLSQGLRKLVGSASRSKCTFIFINQLRYKVGVMYGNPETTSGGNALKFYSSVRIDVRKRESIGSESGSSHVSGIKVRCKVVKNKVAPPFRECLIDILFESGIDKLGGLLDAAEKAGVVRRAGAYYSYVPKDGPEIRLGQGREKSMDELRRNGELAAAVEAATRAALTSDAALLDGEEELLGEGEEDGVDMDLTMEAS